MTPHEGIRAVIMAGLALVFGEMAWRGWQDWRSDFLDIGEWRPWVRRVGTNGRWRTDLLVVGIFATIATTSAISAVTLAVGGFVGAASLTTALLFALMVMAFALRRSATTERRIRGVTASQPSVQQAKALAKSAAETAKQAHLTETEAHEAVVEAERHHEGGTTP
jgi:hypothetical protein